MIKNIIVWTCKGAGHKLFVNQVSTILGGINLSILVLLETRIPSFQGNAILNAIGYDMCEFSEEDGFLGGMEKFENFHFYFENYIPIHSFKNQ